MSLIWIIAGWIGVSVVVALIAALFLRGGGSGGTHAGAALDLMSTRRCKKREQDLQKLQEHQPQR